MNVLQPREVDLLMRHEWSDLVVNGDPELQLILKYEYQEV